MGSRPTLILFLLLPLLLLEVLQVGCEDAEQKKNIEHVLAKSIENLSYMLMDAQTSVEEKVRSDGNSGVKRMRTVFGGTKSYHQATFAEDGVHSIHDHADVTETCGMGEITAVLNGVEFRTRHNDYMLVKPSENSNEYHAVDPIETPPVPQDVLKHNKVEDQISEMKEFFRAFHEQNLTIRDYRHYFLPVLCYLEGAWTLPGEKIEEAFKSERHYYDADTWREMDEKLQFTINSGRQDYKENYVYLPRKIIDMVQSNETNTKIPVIAQWNYRILCHPIAQSLPTNYLRVVDDLASRMAFNTTACQHKNSRYARFQLNPEKQKDWTEGRRMRTFLDELMEQIPGKDNYRASLGDFAFGNPAKQTNPYYGNYYIKNTGFYHRYFMVEFPEEQSYQSRGFADSVFMAMTSNPKVAATKLEICDDNTYYRYCATYEQRWSYAIPLEIIYLTPLFKWNPYNIENKGDHKSEYGKTVTANGATGKTAESPYDGINNHKFYMTPSEFVDQVETGPADTSFEEAFVRARDGRVHNVAPSGQRVFVDIPGVGKVRLRYPITPLYGEGGGAWKEVDALKEFIKNPTKYPNLNVNDCS